MRKVEEIYLQLERYNPRVRATIPGAWIAVLEDGIEIPVAKGYEGKNEAIMNARKMGFNY